ncbi:MAG: hypothetical protein ABSG62_24380 [Terracidiphilus sp.]|jgi:hypothetical protein
MTESISAPEQSKTVSGERREVYNKKVAALFAERDKHPMEPPGRDAAVQRIMGLWVAEG